MLPSVGLRRLLQGSKGDSDSVARIAEQAGRLGVTLVDVAGSMDGVVSRVAEQAAALGKDVEQTAGHIRTSSGAVVAGADALRRYAQDEAGRARASHAELSASMSETGELVDWLAGLGEQLADVLERLQGIAEVTRQIDAIAGQTHILALNTRIEATRAGDAGRGFAVIADNVRDLAQQSVAAARHIDGTLDQLGGPLDGLRGQVADASSRASAARVASSSLGSFVDGVSEAMQRMGDEAASISAAASGSLSRAEQLLGSLNELALGVSSSSAELEQARSGVSDVLDCAESVLDETTRAGVETADTALVHAAVETAQQVSAALEQAVRTGRISMADLFDETYVPVPGSDPQQVLTRFTALTDELLPPVQEPLLTLDPRVTFCAAVDRNGYLPTHNRKFSQRQGRDPVWNAANCRNRRLFDDRTGLTAGRNRASHLLQVYRRDMGGGVFVLMKDVSAPIVVQGRHWGGFRIGYKA